MTRCPRRDQYFAQAYGLDESQIVPLKAGDIVLVDGHLTLTHDAPIRLVSTRETEQ